MTEARPHFTVLGFDYGSKTIGIAVGQSITGTANELPVIRLGESKQSRELHWRQIEQLVKEWKPAALVVGWPLNMDGTESDFCKDTKRFADKLHKRSGVPVQFMDERLTSAEAKMDKDRKTGDYRKNPVDSYAAKLLLESWLRENR